MLLGQLEDPKDYFSKNVVGATWPIKHPKEVYKIIETELGNPELTGRKDDMSINMVNYMNKYMSIPVMPVMDASNGILPEKFEDHAELPQAVNFSSARSAI